MSNRTAKESVVIEATLNWVFLDQVSDMSGKYQVDASNLSEEDQELLQSIGLGHALKDDDHKSKEKKWKREGKLSKDELAEKMASLPVKDTYIVLKSEIKGEKWRNDEDDLRFFTVTTPDKRDVDLSVIGNGTKALIKVEAVPYTGYGGGISAGLAKIIVTDLIEYEGANKDGDMYARAKVAAVANATAHAAEEMEDEVRADAEEAFDYNDD